MEEIWKDCVDWEGRYIVSNTGKVKSLLDSHLNVLLEPREKLLHLGKHGYVHTSFYKNKRMKLMKIHRLVAQAFIPNPNNYATVNHKDCDKTNNHVSNLEWCTTAENNKHAHENGRFTYKFGEESSYVKWTNQEVIDIKTDINKGLTSKELFTKYPKLCSKHLYLFRKNKTFSNLEIRVTVPSPKDSVPLKEVK